MPLGKPAGVRCIHLDVDHLCGLWLHPDRPAVCNSLPAVLDTCGNTFTEAIALMDEMERNTAPTSTIVRFRQTPIST